MELKPSSALNLLFFASPQGTHFKKSFLRLNTDDSGYLDELAAKEQELDYAHAQHDEMVGLAESLSR